MFVRVRQFGKPEMIVGLQNAQTQIEKFRELLEEIFDIKASVQRLVYGGQQLEDGYTLNDYNIKGNDVIELTVCTTQLDTVTQTCSNPRDDGKTGTEIQNKDAESELYAVGDIIDFKDRVKGVWCEGKIISIVCDPNAVPSTDIQAEQRKKNLTAQEKRKLFKENKTKNIKGKTKMCTLPPNHFGAIPGVEVGMCWRFRQQLNEAGVHRPSCGIHGREEEGAYSLILTGGVEDYVDHGNEFTCTGSGGRNLSANKQTAVQFCHQTLTRENKALARNCAVAGLSEQGEDAGDKWREGRPVRVVRSSSMRIQKYVPQEGNRYDGLYKVVKYYPERDLSGFIVWKYLLRRDDPEPAPWEPNAKRFDVIYPDGFLEAEAEKQAQRASKAKTGQLGDEPSSSTLGGRDKSPAKSPMKPSCSQADRPQPPKTKSPTLVKEHKFETGLTQAEERLIIADSLNVKQWFNCLEVSVNRGKKAFIDHVNRVFYCIVCLEMPANPVTAPCFHNFCMSCIQQTMNCPSKARCPWCNSNLTGYVPQINGELQAALRALLTEYDAGNN